jgi:acyl carrier protein phosphodiesterase
MNFLAHIYLSKERPKIMVGNFIGDFVKGKHFSDQFETEIAKGIELHRAIDEFTDRHPIVHQSKSRLRPKYHHYSGVIVDVFYDHFLSKYWSDYHSIPLTNFAANTYTTLKDHYSILPDDVKYMLPYMIKDNWLVNYGHLNGIGQALRGISRRTRYDSKMNESVVELEKYYEEFKTEFRGFFLHLNAHAEAFLEQN